MLYLAILLLLMSIIYTHVHREGFESNPDVVMVVSRYNETLDWLKEEPFAGHEVVVYNKGLNQDFYNPGKTVPLKNVGREGHTYLYHIVEHYDHLPEITIFLPGSLHLSHKIEKGKRMVREIHEKKKAVFVTDWVMIPMLYDFSIDEYTSTASENKSINNESAMELARIRPFGEWSKARFGKGALTHVSYSGVLSVSKQDVLQHPKSYYESLLEELSHSSNPEVGHYVERSWQTIFSMKDTLMV